MARQTQRLEAPDVTGLARAARKAARLPIFNVPNGNPHEDIHRSRVAEDILEDIARGLHPAGRRGGRRVRLVWPSQAAFNAWQTKYVGLPGIRIGTEDRYALTIGAPAYEFPGDDVTPPSGRPFTEVQLSEEEQDWFESNSTTLAEPGTFDPLIDNTL